MRGPRTQSNVAAELGVAISMLGDLKDPRLMYLKAGLFILLGTLACLGLLLEAPTLRVAIFLAVAIWSFARAYYFAFYVIEHYIDPSFRYAGLWAFVRRGSVRSALKSANRFPESASGAR